MRAVVMSWLAVFNDRNGNGQLDPGEPGIPGLQVTLSSSTSLRVQPDGARVTVTDDSGGFAFDRVAGGGYQLMIVDPLGAWPAVTQDVTVIDGSPTVVPPIGFSPPLAKTYIPFAVNNRLPTSPFTGCAESWSASGRR